MYWDNGSIGIVYWDNGSIGIVRKTRIMGVLG